ncbi:hypothetical protein Plec18170_009152 [Paecilomyces lecythidis]
MIDGLLTLHVKRFGFRVMTYLEMYTVFVGATINILDFKESEGLEAEAASARLAFSLEVLRNARSTPSTRRCVEIIQHLLNGKPGSTNNCQRQSTDSREQLTPTEVTSLGGTIPRCLALDPMTRGSLVESNSNLFRSDTMNQMHPDGLSLLDPVETGGIPDIPSRQDMGLQSIHNLQACDVPIGISSMQPNTGSPVQTPLRWLLDNVSDDCGWMMMGMDFTGNLDSISAGQEGS